jgi:hypothetical protein
MLQRDPGIDGPQNSNFGEYLGTFHSANQQVRADYFRRGDRVYVYVSFEKGYTVESATDRWRGALVDEAAQIGVPQENLSIVFH